MHLFSFKRTLVLAIAVISLFSFSSCLTARGLDRYVAKQYNNEIPKPDKKKKADFNVGTSLPIADPAISKTVHKTTSFLPLIVYWQHKHRQICALNNSIAVNKFSNNINATINKSLGQKINGQRLELMVEQAPSGFSIVANEHMVWLVYAFSWARIYIEPDHKDLIVTYKLMHGESIVRQGKITVANTEKARNFRFFQSWKSATSEHLTNYNANLANMSRQFTEQLSKELANGTESITATSATMQ